ncbi:MAG: aminotransferase class I/II-fold pyridoxal phosphate-dependent enzyme [Propionibacteriaceae bacterium]|nr:aminotransferase class I/II-fold pyridoxal phosphate-dependent enzyme [Propionibacteriaceae bacterium]
MINTNYANRFHEVSIAVREGMASGNYPYGQAFASAQRNTASLPTGDPVIMLTSNNYLGLSVDAEVLAAAQRVLQQYGLSTCGARLHNGTTLLHREFEQELAGWLGFDDAVLFSSGFLANVAPLSALGGPGVVYIADQLNHQSIADGCAQSGADLRIFPHNDLIKLEYILRRSQKYESRLVVVDGVYSMDGDLAPLADIQELCQHYDALLMVDDAHGIGVFGETGRGSCEHFGLKPDILMGTLSKSFGSSGGFIAANRELCDYVRHSAHGYIFNASPPPVLIGGALAALQAIRTRPELRQRLWANTIAFRQGLIDQGFAIESGVAPIVPIPVGDDQLAMQMTRQMRDRGVFLSVAAFPAVPRGKSRFRATVTAILEDRDLDHAISVISTTAREKGII